MRIALQGLPSTLEKTYRNILARINQRDVQKIKRALFWILFSLRPLTFNELCEAVIIPEHSDYVDEEMRLLRPWALLSDCSSLISYDTDSTNISLAHSSVMQYLTSDEIQRSEVCEFFLNEEEAETEITTRCLKYLLNSAFDSGYCSDPEKLAIRKEEWPLLDYIAHTLFDHLSYVTLTDSFTPLLLRFFRTQSHPRGGSFGAWAQVFSETFYFDSLESSTPLYYAARSGLLSLVKLLLKLEGTKDLETPGGVYGSTPLHVAAYGGQTEVVRELLAAGANAKEFNQNGETGLLWAITFRHNEIEHMLKEAGGISEPWLYSEESGELIRADIEYE